MIAFTDPGRYASVLTAAVLLAACGTGPAPRTPAPIDDAPRLAVPADRPAPGGPGSLPPIGSAALSGRVLDWQGDPIERARLEARRVADDRAFFTLSDAAGEFRFTELPAGDYTVTAARTGFVTAQYGQLLPPLPGVPLTLAPGGRLEGIDVALTPGRAIEGRVVDEDDAPSAGVLVEALRPVGDGMERQLLVAAASQSDDRGRFRLFGLMPGAYVLRAYDLHLGDPAGAAGPAAFSPTYYPGVTHVAEASTVHLDASRDATGLVIRLQFARPARVSGLLIAPGPARLFGASAVMAPADGPRRALAPPFSAHILPDGRYEFVGIPPGRYRIMARVVPAAGERQDPPGLFATFVTTVDGRDLSDLNLMLQPGAILRGRVEFEGGPLPAPDPGRIWVEARPADGTAFGVARAPVRPDGSFVVAGIPPGGHLLRAGAVPSPWRLASVMLRGRDVIDIPLDVEYGQSIGDLRLRFSVRAAELTGTIRIADGRPCTDCAVLVFPTDPSLWRPLSRHLAFARADLNGAYRVRGLPAGPYLVAPLLNAVEADLFEPDLLAFLAPRAAAVTLDDHEVRTLDLTVEPPSAEVAAW